MLQRFKVAFLKIQNVRIGTNFVNPVTYVATLLKQMCYHST